MIDKFLMSLESLLDLRKSNKHSNTPSDYALLNAIEILQAVFHHLRKEEKDFHYCHFDVKPEGDVYLVWTWAVSEREVRVVVDAKSSCNNSVYYKQGNNSNFIENPSIEQICQLVLWCRSENELNNKWLPLVSSK